MTTTTRTLPATYKGYTDIYSGPKFRIEVRDFLPGSQALAGVYAAWAGPKGETEQFVCGEKFMVEFDDARRVVVSARRMAS